ncbi:MAG: lysylphosphatidylglycerol synthase transmembrane domain-containing protein [Acidimicrobiales bacterium]
MGASSSSALQPAGPQLFASSSDAPRARRPVDWATLIGAAIVASLLGWAASSRVAIDDRFVDLVDALPGWLDFLAKLAFAAGGIYLVVLVVLIVVRGAHRSIARDVAIVSVLTVLVVVLAGQAATGVWPDFLPELVDVGDRLSYPAARLTLLIAVVATIAPHLTAPARRLNRRVVATTAVSGVLLGFISVTGLLGALTIGGGMAALIHVVFGSPGGLPSTERLIAALHELGVDADGVSLLDEQPVGAARCRAWVIGGEDRQAADYEVKVIGRDAADAQLFEKTWRSLWYRDAGPSLSLSRAQQVEHEAVALLLAERRGASVAEVVVAGEDSSGNALLVTNWIDGETLAPPDIGPAWVALRQLHDAGATHGSIDIDTVVVDGGLVVLRELSRSTLSRSGPRRNADVVALLAVSACVAGSDNAIDAAVEALSADEVGAAIPYLQEVTLRPSLRNAVRDHKIDLDTLGDRLVERTGIAKPERANVRRVGLKDIALAVFAIVAANAIISQVAEVGLDVLVDEVSNAEPGWLVVSFLVAIAAYFGDVISLGGALLQPLPIGPTFLLQSAKRFIGLAVPSVAGRVALDIRFLQKLGVPVATAAAQGPLIGFIGFLVEVVLLLLTAAIVGADLHLGEIDGGSIALLALLALGAALLGGAVVWFVPKLRDLLVPPIVEGVRSVAGVLRSPGRLGRMAGGQLLDRVVGALALAATVAAFGESVSFAAIIFVSVGSGLLAGLAPVPGGIGVAEATLIALLTAVGVPPEVAFSATITHRVITAYLPPVLGYFAYRWLDHNSYL